MQDDIQNRVFDLRNVAGFLRRRWLAIVVSAAAAIAISVVTAALWPPTYRSTATILVEEQEIPQDLVRTTVTSYADQRIQVIGQQVMTRQNLLQIIDKYDLYKNKRRTRTNEEILEGMRKDVRIDVVSADVAGGRRVTIAFNLSYEGESPAQTQKVASELVTLYLNENLKIRQQKAEETATFLAEEARRLEQHISGIEERLAQFKRRNRGQLPELTQLNMQMLERTESELADLERGTQLLEQRRFLLSSQLDQTDPEALDRSDTGERVRSPAEQLRTLRSQYAGLRGVYSEDHPDMIRMRQQMVSLENEARADERTAKAAGGAANDGERERLIEALTAERVEMRERYSDDHPDVVRLDKRLAGLEQGAAEASLDDSAAVRNPIYLSLNTQLQMLDSEQASLQKKRRELTQRLAAYEQRLTQTPQVEQEYLDLTRERENTLVRYREMKQKQMQAEVAQELEKERKGERFSLIDPPQFPEKPRSPNRPAILLLGMVAGLGSGMGAGGALEVLDRSIKTPLQLARVAPAPVLSVIPHIETARERRARRRRRWLIGACIVLALLLSALLVHVLHKPLNVLWFVLLRWLGI